MLSVAEELGIGSYCLFVGSLELRKSPDLLVRALSEAPGITCIFVGDGPAKHRIRQLANCSWAWRSGFKFAGHLKPADLGRYYAGADLLVLPSVSEASPLVILEAMACGTPVVASRVGGIPAVVEDWKTGFLVKPGDVGQLTMCLRFLTEDKPLLRAWVRRRSGACGAGCGRRGARALHRPVPGAFGRRARPESEHVGRRTVAVPSTLPGRAGAGGGSDRAAGLDANAPTSRSASSRTRSGTTISARR